MATAARVPMAARRWEPCVRTIRIRGIDLTPILNSAAAANGFDLLAELRLAPDTPGAPLVSLPLVATPGTQGLRVSAVEILDGVPVSIIEWRINEPTMEGLPFMGEVGEATPLSFGLQLTTGGLKRTRMEGEFLVLPGSVGSDSAATSRPSGSGSSRSLPDVWTSADLTIGNDEITELVIDGSVELGAISAATEAAAIRAEASAVAVEELLDGLPLRSDVRASVLFALADEATKRSSLEWRGNGDIYARLSSDSRVPGAYRKPTDPRLAPYLFASVSPDGSYVSEAAIMASNGRFPSRVPGRFSGYALDIRSLLRDTKSLPNDGVQSASSLLQEAIEIAAARYAATGLPVSVFVPDGRYRLPVSLTARSGVGVRGQSRTGTVFLPVGSASFVIRRFPTGTFGSDAETLTEMHFADFTVDCIGQTGSESSCKSFYIQQLSRSTFCDMTLLNSFDTNFGNDFYRDCLVSGLYVAGSGRNTANTDEVGTGAGIGIATGRWADESVTIVGCISLNNRTHGFFTELAPHRLGSLPEMPGGWLSSGTSLQGCIAKGNNIGWFDSGSTGATWEGGALVGNKWAGALYSGGPNAGNDGGRLGRLSGAQVYRNGFNAPSGRRGGGVVFDKVSKYGSQIDGNTILGNLHGITVVSSATVGEGLSITRNKIGENAGAGIYSNMTAPLRRLRIEGNDVFDNGADAGQSVRDGIRIDTPLVNPRIVGNNVNDRRNTGKTQQRGLVVGSVAVSNPRIKDNDLMGNVGASLTNTSTITGTSDVSGNLE